MTVGSLVALFSWSVFFGGLCKMSHAKSKSKPDNFKAKSSPSITVYYTNVGLRGNFTALKAFMLRTTPTSLLSVKPTCMATSRALISNSLATCQSIERMLGICMAFLFMLSAIFRLLERLFLRMKTSHICVFVLLFSNLLPSYFSCIVCHLRHLVLCLRLCHPI